MIWIKLPEKPIDFIKKEMLPGKSISNRILKSNKLNSIEEVYCLTLGNVSMSDVYDFDAGKLFGIDEIYEEFTSYLESSYKHYTVIIENWMSAKNDLGVKLINVPKLFIKDEVYFYYSKKWNKLNVLRKILYRGDCYPFIAFILNTDDIKETKLDERSIDDIIRHIKEIVLGIYDGESFMRVKIK